MVHDHKNSLINSFLTGICGTSVRSRKVNPVGSVSGKIVRRVPIFHVHYPGSNPTSSILLAVGLEQVT